MLEYNQSSFSIATCAVVGTFITRLKHRICKYVRHNKMSSGDKGVQGLQYLNFFFIFPEILAFKCFIILFKAG